MRDIQASAPRRVETMGGPRSAAPLDPRREEAAYRHCESITRHSARNFWYGIRLLPAPKRRALAAVYAMARRIDDVGDGNLPLERKRSELEAIEASIPRASIREPDPVLAALAAAAAVFPLPMGAFNELVAGVRMDLDGTRYETFQDLELYCRRVAGAVGRLSVAVFGGGGERAEVLADDLGVAMQLTNILRDVGEDTERGRVYLPAEDLERFGCGPGDLRAPAGPRVVELLRFEAERAGRWFERGLRLLPRLDRRSAACAGAMAGIYARLLRRISAHPDAVLARRVVLPPWEKAWVAARALAGVVPEP